jgi:hypothetical protein
MGLLLLFVKNNRFIYILLSLEFLVIGLIFYLFFSLSVSLLISLLVFCAGTSIMGLLIIVVLFGSYGSELVKF